MNLADHMRFSIAHSAWALAQLLDHADRLTDEQLDRDLGIGPGPLRANIAHTIEVVFFFADNFRGRAYEQPADFETLARSTDGLRTLLARAAAELQGALAEAFARGLPGRIAWPSADSGWMSAHAALAQVTDHAAAHRAQCVNMLKRLGLAAPDLDPMSFEATGSAW